jgi:hypothetical protein
MNPASPAACPKCGYVRSPQDRAPDWQCAACGIAIAKFQAQAKGETPPAGTEEVLEMRVDPPRLPLANRIGSALPDLVMAGLFLWCWLSPLAWHPKLASELGSLVLMLFFTMHSSIFLTAASGGPQDSGRRLVGALIMLAFYLPVAGAFAYFHGGWTPFAGFAWLLLANVATMLAARGPDDFQSRRMRFYWGSAAGYYILAGLAIAVLPLPQLGFRNASVDWPVWWSIDRQNVVAWGLLYFGAMGVTKLLETPQMILREE